MTPVFKPILPGRPPTGRRPTLLYIGENPAAQTGTPVIVLRHLQRFSAEGWAVAVLAEYHGDYRECIRAGWPVARLCHRRWWWPPLRHKVAGLLWMRLRLLARETVASTPKPDIVLTYLAPHTDFSARLALHVARITGAPLHVLVHDDATAFPVSRGREKQIREAHDQLLSQADGCWFASPELADCYPSSAPHRHVLYPIPEGWAAPAQWRESFAKNTDVYYAGRLWPAQCPLLDRIAAQAHTVGGDVVVMTREWPALRTSCEAAGIRLQPPFPTNREALAHLATNAAGVLVSYADSIAAMPWCATSFPSKLIEYCHLGLPIAIVAPAESAVGRWAQRVCFRNFYTPHELDRLPLWFGRLKLRATWEEESARSLALARSEFDPVRIHAGFSAGLGVNVEQAA